ncbi:MAG: ADP-ribosylglycohydrolase family protein [Lachnospiraceae bacterium]|nr:ADP-ribosylglycohydrolase family protein [Lachnospiraceae bacterium]
MENPKPYNSFGNGSAMRVSPCGIVAVCMEEAVALARASASVTHNHPEGIKGAEAVAAAIFLAKMGKSREEIRSHICEHYYELNTTVDEIRVHYGFDESCQGTVPEALICFLESESFEDAIRNAISIGGDSDTVGAITGSVAWTYYCREKGYSQWVYEVPEEMAAIRQQALAYIPEDFVKTAEELHEAAWRRMGTYGRVGSCTWILSPGEIRENQF